MTMGEPQRRFLFASWEGGGNVPPLVRRASSGTAPGCASRPRRGRGRSGALARLLAEPTFRDRAGQLGAAVRADAEDGRVVAELEGLAAPDG